MSNLNASKNAVSAYSFGDPESVIGTSLTDYLGVFLQDNGQFYQPPVSFRGLAQTLRANPHHGAIAYFKRNMLLRFFIASALLGHEDFKRIAFDFVVFGNAFLQVVRTVLGMPVKLIHLPALNMRRRKDGTYLMLQPNGSYIEFRPDEVLHLLEYDVNQTIYGVPEYYAGIQSMLLNEDATLFRRRYFRNGAHVGYIFYTNDPYMGDEDEKLLQQKIAASKGVGNFRSMFIRIPNGGEKAVQIIPIGDNATKDEFEKIKNITRNDIISAWRMRPELAGVMPEVTGGTGDITKINEVYIANEMKPLAQQFEGINEILGRTAVAFDFNR